MLRIEPHVRELRALVSQRGFPPHRGVPARVPATVPAPTRRRLPAPARRQLTAPVRRLSFIGHSLGGIIGRACVAHELMAPVRARAAIYAHLYQRLLLLLLYYYYYYYYYCY